MAGSIGRMERRVGEFAVRSSVHLLGAVAGGALLGIVLAVASMIGGVVPRRSLVVVVMVGILATAQILYPRVRLGPRRQVPMGWSETLGTYGSLFSWGAALSMGYFTQTRSLLVWALPAAALVTEPVAAFWAGVAFGGSRGLSAVILAARLTDPAHACRVLGRRRVSDLVSFAAMVAFLAVAL